MHHHHFLITKFLFLIGILVGVFYAFNYIKERYQVYQAYQAYQAQKTYYQKVNKGRKGLEKKSIESAEKGSVNEGGEGLKKERKTPKKKACFIYSEWEGCEEE